MAHLAATPDATNRLDSQGPPRVKWVHEVSAMTLGCSNKISAMTTPRSVYLACMAVLALGLTFAPLRAQKPEQGSGQAPAPGPHQHQGMSGHDMPGMDMPGMDATRPADGGDSTADEAQRGAVRAMSRSAAGSAHHHQPGSHMHMTTLRPATPEDWAKADTLSRQVSEAIEPYKDYRVALADGFRIFMPDVPQPEYHFTSYQNGFLESFSFDPARPTALLYKKTDSGYDLTGAMYTMPRRVSEEQLNERIPLSITRWHLHTNLCMPPRGQGRNADWSKFGLQGSIATREACGQQGGRFYPVVFGWMAHVYPFEATREQVWAR